MNDEKLAILTLLQYKGVGYKTISHYLGQTQSYRLALEKMQSEGVVKKSELGQAQRATWQIIKDCEQKSLGITTIADSNYPSSLKQIGDPPLVLYHDGDWGALSLPAIAVVGSRKPTVYANRVAGTILPPLIMSGIVLVSGFQLGVDSLAHDLCIKHGRATIAVLGSGLDVAYPYNSRGRYQQIIDNRGLIISEFATGVKPHPAFFPQRNRIIAALSKGVLVIEAALRSGSQNTAMHALEQGKEVWAVPGSIFSENSAGTNYLIKNGAQLVSEAADIAAVQPQRGMIGELSEGERVVVGCIKERQVSLDELVDNLNMGAVEVMSILTSLELRGVVQKLEDDTYQTLV